MEDSIAVKTVPEAPWPICSSLVYLRLGSPTETIVRSFSRISSSDIFFFLIWPGVRCWPACKPGVCVPIVPNVLFVVTAVVVVVVDVVVGSVPCCCCCK